MLHVSTEVFFEPTCAHAWWAHMHYFLSVWCDLTEITLEKFFMDEPLDRFLLYRVCMGSRQCQVAFFFCIERQRVNIHGVLVLLSMELCPIG